MRPDVPLPWSETPVRPAGLDRPGCSIKDSFARLDLASFGFEVLFRPTLLGRPDVAVLAGEQDGEIVAGALVTLGPPTVAGITNVFTRPGADPDPWPALLALARDLFPDHILVGYESGSGLVRAQRAGFRPLGPLRVWASEPAEDTAPGGR